MTDRYQTDLSDALRTSGVAWIGKPMPDEIPGDMAQMPEPQSAREHLRDTRMIWFRWAIIGLLTCFWIFIAQHWHTVVHNWQAIRGWFA